MENVRRFLVAGTADTRGLSRIWPWLGLVPGFWRHSAARLAGPRCALTAATKDGGLLGHSLALAPVWPPEKAAAALALTTARLAPLAFGWESPDPPPPLPGIAWHSGRLFGLLSVLGLFHPGLGVYRRPADLEMLLIGGDQPALAVAARFLAHHVGRLTLACPAENFRNRLAGQILTESGLAVLTRPEAPSNGWEIALDFRAFPPLILHGDNTQQARPLFPQPLCPAGDGRASPPVDLEHPLWAECHLACLAGEDAAPLPHLLSIGAIRTAFGHAERAELRFTLA